MIIRECSVCGHTNFSFSRKCMGCGAVFPRRTRDLSWRNRISVLLLGASLLAAAAGGVFWLVQRILPPLRALLLGS